jgi:hypothetical protein
LLVESTIIEDLRRISAAKQNELNLLTNSGYTLKFQAKSGLNTHNFELRGPIDISNEDFVAQFDKMVDDMWSLKVTAKDGVVKSISLACRAIGYCNLLIFVKSQNESDSPLNRYDISLILAEFAIMRIKDIFNNAMGMVRSVQYELDAEARSFMAIWWHYLSILRTQFRKLSSYKLFVRSTTPSFNLLVS